MNSTLIKIQLIVSISESLSFYEAPFSVYNVKKSKKKITWNHKSLVFNTRHIKTIETPDCGDEFKIECQMTP